MPILLLVISFEKSVVFVFVCVHTLMFPYWGLEVRILSLQYVHVTMVVIANYYRQYGTMCWLLVIALHPCTRGKVVRFVCHLLSTQKSPRSHNLGIVLSHMQNGSIEIKSKSVTCHYLGHGVHSTMHFVHPN